MNATIEFLKNKFSNYYADAKLSYPERFTRREWGFMFLGETFMQRHLGFRKTVELVNFLSAGAGAGTGAGTGTGSSNHQIHKGKKNKSTPNKVPSHVYYSSAYYSNPNLQPMPAKVAGWLGADLIFDLDDDHLRNIEGLSYGERLAKVKNIVRHKLLDDFFLGDFGFDSKFITIAFSGSRGYHIHIRDPKVLLLTSAERRELVDYLTGVGLDKDRIFPKQVFDTKEYGDKKFSKKPKVITPKLDSPGWKGRMARGILELITKLSKLTEEEGINELCTLCQNLRIKGRKISNKDITAIYQELFLRSVKLDKTTFEQRNVLEIFSKDQYRNIFLEIVREHQSIEMAGETDEPVTTDVKRLIRMPTSLHGKTGFRVAPLTIDELAEFDPFSDALAFGSDPVKVNVNEQIEATVNEHLKFRLGGEDFSVMPGEDGLELPEFAAIYLLCQRKAVIA